MAQTVQRVTALKVTVGDRVGALAEVVAQARDAGLDFRSVTALAAGGQGVIMAVPTDLQAARQAAAGGPYAITEQDVFWVEGDDERGALAPAADKLAAAGISVTAVHAAAVEGRFAAVFYVAPEDVEKAAAALGV
jgi:hypothetical protein